MSKTTFIKKTWSDDTGGGVLAGKALAVWGTAFVAFGHEAQRSGRAGYEPAPEAPGEPARRRGVDCR